MTDREAFIRAILANPADDLPRLVFADWLDEHGENERAEFIRVQCELAKVPGSCNFDPPEGVRCASPSCRYCALRRRERESWDGGLFDAMADEVDAVYKGGLVFGLGEMNVTWGPHGMDCWPGHSKGLVKNCSFLPEAVEPIIGLGVSRGFVSLAKCSLAAWIGVPCGRCRGRGKLWNGGWDGRISSIVSASGMQDCPVCSGNGRINEAGPLMVSSFPIQRVTLIDRESVPVSNGEWEYPISNQRDARNAIPWDVYDLFPWKRLRSEAEAKDALSQGLIAWAKGGKK